MGVQIHNEDDAIAVASRMPSHEMNRCFELYQADRLITKYSYTNHFPV